jgi:hypothetical protein
MTEERRRIPPTRRAGRTGQHHSRSLLSFAHGGDGLLVLLTVAFLAVATVGLPAALLAQCRIESTATAADLELARTACQRVEERFALLYGVPAPPGAIQLSDEIAFFEVEDYFPEWKLVWPTSERMREYFALAPPTDQTVDDAIRVQWSSVLPHEIGHLLLTAEAARRRPANDSARALPDWIHEGTAVWMEPPSYRESEYRIIRALQPFVPQLDTLLSLAISTPGERGEAGTTITRTFYPCASEPACGGRPHWSETFSVTTRQHPDGRVVIDTVFHAGPPPPPDPSAANFYAYSAALVRYLHYRGGAAALDALLERFADSSRATVPITGLPGLPSSPARVQQDWVDWVERWIFPDAPGSAPEPLACSGTSAESPCNGA